MLKKRLCDVFRDNINLEKHFVLGVINCASSLVQQFGMICSLFESILFRIKFAEWNATLCANSWNFYFCFVKTCQGTSPRVINFPRQDDTTDNGIDSLLNEKITLSFESWIFSCDFNYYLHITQYLNILHNFNSN